MPILLAGPNIAPQTSTFWWVSIGLAFVVVLVVIVLLTLLVSLVKDINRNVSGLWSTAEMVARNTATSWQLRQSAELANALGKEVDNHVQFLANARGGPR